MGKKQDALGSKGERMVEVRTQLRDREEGADMKKRLSRPKKTHVGSL